MPQRHLPSAVTSNLIGSPSICNVYRVPAPLECSAYTLASCDPEASPSTTKLYPCHSSLDQPAATTSRRARPATCVPISFPSINNCTSTRCHGSASLTTHPEILFVPTTASPQP